MNDKEQNIDLVFPSEKKQWEKPKLDNLDFCKSEAADATSPDYSAGLDS